MTGVFITLKLQFKPGLLAGFAQDLPQVLEETKRFDGFIEIAAYRHEEDADRLIVAERWESADAYKAYIAWRVSTGFMDALGNALAEPPAIDIWPDRIA